MSTERSIPRISRPQKIGRSAEHYVRMLLEKRGRTVQRMRYTSPFDLLVDGSLRIEVKCAEVQWSRGMPTWIFNIHRHGTVNEQHTDYYVLRLEGVPYFKAAIHLLFKAPLNKATIAVSLRALLTRYAPNVVAFRDFCKADTRKD